MKNKISYKKRIKAMQDKIQIKIIVIIEMQPIVY